MTDDATALPQPAPDFTAYFDIIRELGKDFDDPWLNGERPLLAHYTSMETAASIIQNATVWFSNPLFMNDLEELNAGLNLGVSQFLASEEVVAACGTPEIAQEVKLSFSRVYDSFAQTHALDVYVLCFSEHDPNDVDGKLSMWRAYGDKGNGAAIIFDSTKIEAVDSSPLIMAKVKYWPREVRLRWVVEKIQQWCWIVSRRNMNVQQLCLAAAALFQTFKYFALVTKHHGFREEQEWRAIYFPERDSKNKLHQYYSYHLTGAGVQPKLKLPIAPIEGITNQNFSFDEIVRAIMLGPTASSALARSSFIRMLQTMGKGHLDRRVLSSSIPLRPSN